MATVDSKHHCYLDENTANSSLAKLEAWRISRNSRFQMYHQNDIVVNEKKQT